MSRPANQIRELNPQDFDRVIALWKKAGLHSLKPHGRDSRDSFEQQITSGISCVLGLEQGDHLIGVVTTSHDSRKGWINRLAIDPAERHKGWARALLSAAEEKLRSQEIRIIAALIEPGNEPSYHLFQSSGYIEFPGMRYLTKRESDDV